MMQDEPVVDEESKPADVTVEEITLEIVQEQLVNNYRPVQPINNRLIYRTFMFEPRKEVRYVVRYDSQKNNLAISSSVPSFIILISCFIISLFFRR